MKTSKRSRALNVETDGAGGPHPPHSSLASERLHSSSSSFPSFSCPQGAPFQLHYPCHSVPAINRLLNSTSASLFAAARGCILEKSQYYVFLLFLSSEACKEAFLCCAVTAVSLVKLVVEVPLVDSKILFFSVWRMLCGA